MSIYFKIFHVTIMSITIGLISFAIPFRLFSIHITYLYYKTNIKKEEVNNELWSLNLSKRNIIY